MTNKPIRASYPIRQRARELRQDSTPAEAHLWKHLRGRQLQNLKWRRQHPIERYIVDFICIEARLIVEIDGDIHLYQQESDTYRTAFLESCNYRVLRFANDTVLNHLDTVLSAIAQAAAHP
jgi:very-short-patch-repair endonuclease